jgi:sugar lactone lactonase YvrE
MARRRTPSAWLVAGAALVACHVSGSDFTRTDAPGGGGGGGGDAHGDAATDGAVTPRAQVVLFAGDIGGPGTLDGVAADAHFSGTIHGATVAPDGRIYLADESNHTIRVVDSGGSATTLGPPGQPLAFVDPQGVVVDGSGNVYVADGSGRTVWLVDTQLEKHELVGSDLGAMRSFTLMSPTALALGSQGELYISDSAQNRIIRSTGSNTAVLSATGVTLKNPQGIAFAGDGFLYVADAGEDVIVQVDLAHGSASVLAGSVGSAGTSNLTGSAARFNTPSGLVADGSASLYIVDQPGGTSLRQVALGATRGETSVVIPSVDTTGHAYSAVAVGGDHTVYLTDRSRVLEWPQGVGAWSGFAGSVAQTGDASGEGATARFSSPTGMCVLGSNDVYVADPAAQDVRQVSGVDGFASAPGLWSSMSTFAQFITPTGVVPDGSGGLFIADRDENVIFQAEPMTMQYTLYAGDESGHAGTHGGALADSQFHTPTDLAMGSDGTLYVADVGNAEVRAIGSGQVTSLVATDPSDPPQRLGFGAGRLFASYADQTIEIAHPDSLELFAGGSNLRGSADAAGANARFSTPLGVVVDHLGNVYVADQANSEIRKIDPSGNVTTIVGYSGQVGIRLGSGSDARLGAPVGLAILGNDLLVSDTAAVLRVVDVIP